MKSLFSKSLGLMVVKVISFFIILAGIIALATYMLMPKSSGSSGGMDNPNAHGFYGEPENSLDMVLIGNSDAYSGFSPLELWNQEGYTSYIAAEGNQTLSASVNMLNQVLDSQNPKLIILETDTIFSGTSSKMVEAFVKEKFPILEYHDRWKSVKAKELFEKPSYTYICACKGQYISTKVAPYNGPNYMIETNKKKKIKLISEIFLDNFVNMCKERDIDLLFVHIPSKVSWSYEKHNSIQKYADDRGIPFVDLDLLQDEIGLDWKKDTRDSGNHLNCYGAKKVTKYLGEYLKNNYDFVDHRSDSFYDYWNNYYKKYADGKMSE